MEKWLELFAETNFRRSADTAHDLKTPLNVAVLNLELLRMRLQKLEGAKDDPKITAYASSIETELRRMATIFDTIFLLGTPPKENAAPEAIDLGPILRDEAAESGWDLGATGAIPMTAHPARMRQAVRMFFEGAGRALAVEGRKAAISHAGAAVTITLSAPAPAEGSELTKVFKFYYTDPSGSPDLSLAAARLIAETYGGEMTVEESERVVFRLTLPLGEE